TGMNRGKPSPAELTDKRLATGGGGQANERQASQGQGDQMQADQGAARPDYERAGPKANPVGATAGAAGGAAAGAAIGIMGGPVGRAAGAVACDVAGGALGKDQVRAVSTEDEYWLQNFASRPYATTGASYEDCEQAYRYGYKAFDEYAGRL